MCNEDQIRMILPDLFPNHSVKGNQRSIKQTACNFRKKAVTKPDLRALTNVKALRDQYLAFMEEYLSLDHMVEVPKQH